MKQAQTKTPFHCLVWIDHGMARIFAVTQREMTELATLYAPEGGVAIFITVLGRADLAMSPCQRSF